MRSRRSVPAALALALLGCGRPVAPTAAAKGDPPPLPQDVRDVQAVASPAAPAPQGAEATTVEATGELVSPIQSQLVSKIAGRVGRVFADEGSRVQRGQALLEIEADYLRLDVRRAEADLARAVAAGADAKRDFERKTELIAKDSVARAAFDRSRATFDQSEAARASAEVALALARQRLADSVLVSPIDGVVLTRRADVGQRLGDDTVAFVLVQTAPLKLRFRVAERYLSRVAPGMPVRASVDPYPNQAFDGTVAVVGQAIDPATRTLLVEAEFPNRDGRLRSGLFARVVLDLRSR